MTCVIVHRGSARGHHATVHHHVKMPKLLLPSLLSPPTGEAGFLLCFYCGGTKFRSETSLCKLFNLPWRLSAMQSVWGSGERSCQYSHQVSLTVITSLPFPPGNREFSILADLDSASKVGTPLLPPRTRGIWVLDSFGLSIKSLDTPPPTQQK